MKLGVCQMTVSEKTRVNLNKILNFLDEAVEHDIDLLVFPEMVLQVIHQMLYYLQRLTI